MLTRRKRIGIDSSPKTSIGKNAHLLTKKTTQDTANMLSTPPTRRNRFMLENGNANMMDDSPVLSQETIHISWKWKNDSTPNRPTNKASKLKRSTANNSAYFSNLQRLKYNSNNNGETTSSGVSPMVVVEPETHSPKGLYKFQEEMRKIQCEIESDTSCDNIFSDKSTTASDTGYPTSLKVVAQADNTNAKCSDSSDVYMMNGADEPAKMTQNEKHSVVDNLAEDLLNDSDFDQILLTCKMPAQTETCKMASEPNRLSVKKASSAPEIKASGSGSNWNLVDDFDDLVKDIDFDVDISSTLNASAKFTRHKSMPQQPQKPTTSSSSSSTTTKTFEQTMQVDDNHLNRKSFTRHESMPIRSINRPPSNKNNNISSKQNSALSSTQERKCTKEEIAEKRRQAIERLKNRKQSKEKSKLNRRSNKKFPIRNILFYFFTLNILGIHVLSFDFIQKKKRTTMRKRKKYYKIGKNLYRKKINVQVQPFEYQDIFIENKSYALSLNDILFLNGGKNIVVL